MVILMLPMGILIAVFLNTVQQKLENKKRKSGVILISFILICIYLDHLNLGNNSEFSISGIREYTASLAKPPEDCRIFFITIQPDPVHASWTKDEMNFEQSLSQLDAMTIAAHFKIKTLNGYSGHAPRNWDLHFVFREDYMKLLQHWAKTQSITEPVYRYDLTENKWYGPINLLEQ